MIKNYSEKYYQLRKYFIIFILNDYLVNYLHVDYQMLYESN